MADIKSPRRYFLGKRLEARDLGLGLESIWKTKQEAEPGTALPADFPLLSRLTDCGYTTEEDLDGADADELEQFGFHAREATEIFSALAEL